MTQTSPISASWRPIILLWLTGVIAAAALGKFASLTPLIVADLHAAVGFQADDQCPPSALT